MSTNGFVPLHFRITPQEEGGNTSRILFWALLIIGGSGLLSILHELYVLLFQENDLEEVVDAVYHIGSFAFLILLFLGTFLRIQKGQREEPFSGLGAVGAGLVMFFREFHEWTMDPGGPFFGLEMIIYFPLMIIGSLIIFNGYQRGSLFRIWYQGTLRSEGDRLILMLDGVPWYGRHLFRKRLPLRVRDVQEKDGHLLLLVRPTAPNFIEENEYLAVEMAFEDEPTQQAQREELKKLVDRRKA